jgi:hypothetical protein
MRNNDYSVKLTPFKFKVKGVVNLDIMRSIIGQKNRGSKNIS